jgi:hypothetical protein
MQEWGDLAKRSRCVILPPLAVYQKQKRMESPPQMHQLVQIHPVCDLGKVKCPTGMKENEGF